MKVQCENCGTKLSLPDEKLVPGTDFTFNCPKCRQQNTIKVPAQETGSGPVLNGEDEGAAGEFYEEGSKLALICFDEGPTRDNLAKIMTEMDYIPVIPSSARDALKRIRLTQFSVILLDENYAGQSKDNNVILRLLQPMDMTTRRRIFVALFGKDYNTFDNMTAFALSVNALINLSDEAQFGKVLHKGLADYDRFYKVYFDVMREMGKA